MHTTALPFDHAGVNPFSVVKALSSPASRKQCQHVLSITSPASTAHTGDDVDCCAPIALVAMGATKQRHRDAIPIMYSMKPLF